MNGSTLDPTNPTERRELRSSMRYQAAEFYLGSLKHRRALRTAAVSDDKGLLLAGVGTRREQELLALWGALDAGQRQRYEPEINALCVDGACIVSRFEIDGDRFAVTEIASGNGAAGTIADDMQRILSAPADQSLTFYQLSKLSSGGPREGRLWGRHV